MLPIIYISQSRTGVRTIIRTARLLCRLLYTWQSVILKAVGNNPDVDAAIQAALAACAVLESTLDRHLEKEFPNSPV